MFVKIFTDEIDSEYTYWDLEQLVNHWLKENDVVIHSMHVTEVCDPSASMTALTIVLLYSPAVVRGSAR